jgi:Protein of unknown function (DUF1573)
MIILIRNLWIWLLITAITVGALAFFYFGRRANSPIPPIPPVTFLANQHDFGKVRAGDPLTCTFEFVNTIQVPVTLQKVQSSCGCLVAASSSAQFGPGEKGTIRVSLSTRGIAPPAEVRKKVSIVFEGNGTFTVALVVSAQVRPEVRAEPAEIRLLRDRSKPVASQKVVITREMLSPEVFSKLRLELPRLVTATLERSDADERAYDLAFNTAAMTAFPAPVEIVCGDGADAERIPIRLSVSDAHDGVRVSPSLFYASLTRGEDDKEPLRQASRSFILRSDGRDDVAVEKLEGDDKWLTWSIRPGPRPIAFDVRLKAVPPGDVYSSALMVYYTADQGRIRGKLPIDVRVVITPR